MKANQGAAGVDGQSIAEFETDLKNNLYKLWNRLLSVSVARDLRSYSETSGLTHGEIVERAILRFLKATRRHG